MKTATFAGCIVGMVLAIGCKDPPTQPSATPFQDATGAVSFSLSKATIPRGVTWIYLSLTRDDKPSIYDSTRVTDGSDSLKLTVTNVAVGLWKLTVLAKDSAFRVCYQGGSEVEVIALQTTQVWVYMVPVGQTGNVEVHVIWSNGPARSSWHIYENNPVLEPTPGGWDSNHVYFNYQCVLKIDGVYKMWYTTGFSQSIQGYDTLWTAFATSVDGVNWTKHGPVLGGGPFGSWTEKGRLARAMLFEAGVYKMWFDAKSSVNIHNGIGYATSSDGIRWNASADPAISTSSSKPAVFGPSVTKINDVYYLYYTVEQRRNSDIVEEIFLATSADGVTWVDQGPVLEGRSAVIWESSGPFAPSVIFDENRFKLYYSAYVGERSSIGYAESYDGIHWARIGNSPEIQVTDVVSMRALSVAYPCVLRDGAKLRMWFSVLRSNPYGWTINLAEK